MLLQIIVQISNMYSDGLICAIYILVLYIVHSSILGLCFLGEIRRSHVFKATTGKNILHYTSVFLLEIVVLPLEIEHARRPPFRLIVLTALLTGFQLTDLRNSPKILKD